MFIVTNAENIKALWKKFDIVAGSAIQTFCLRFLFAMPKEAIERYISNNSSISTKSHPKSNIAPHNRVDHLTHLSLIKFLSGDGLTKFYKRWQVEFERRLDQFGVQDEWMKMSDLMTFWDETFAVAVLEAYTEPLLQCINPDFMHDLRTYDSFIPDLSRGFPRWMNLKAYAARGKVLTSILQWHAIARGLFKKSTVDEAEDTDPYWGSFFIRDRQRIFNAVDGFDHRAHAASNVRFIWAYAVPIYPCFWYRLFHVWLIWHRANINFVPTSMWQIYATFQDTFLLSRVRSELSTTFSETTSSEMAYDEEKFKDLHLFQSIYAETLRLRFYAYVVRYIEGNDLQINEWFYLKHSVILISTVPAHMNQTFWNTQNEAHPIDTFWSDRFLVYPSDPNSGPLKNAIGSATGGEGKGQGGTADDAPTFTTVGTNGSWIPYGGGPRTCPGRYFAKRVMLAACAMMVTLYDIELQIADDDPALKLNPKFYGWGGQRPSGKIPFRIRKRKAHCCT